MAYDLVYSFCVRNLITTFITRIDWWIFDGSSDIRLFLWQKMHILKTYIFGHELNFFQLWFPQIVSQRYYTSMNISHFLDCISFENVESAYNLFKLCISGERNWIPLSNVSTCCPYCAVSWYWWGKFLFFCIMLQYYCLNGSWNQYSISFHAHIRWI